MLYPIARHFLFKLNPERTATSLAKALDVVLS